MVGLRFLMTKNGWFAMAGRFAGNIMPISGYWKSAYKLRFLYVRILIFRSLCKICFSRMVGLRFLMTKMVVLGWLEDSPEISCPQVGTGKVPIKPCDFFDMQNPIFRSPCEILFSRMVGLRFLITNYSCFGMAWRLVKICAYKWHS